MAELELHSREQTKLHEVFQEVTKGFFHGPEDLKWPPTHSSLAFLQRTRDSFRERSPHIKAAVRNTSSEIVKWMHKGGPWRAFLVTTVGVVLLLGLAGLGASIILLLVATLNAVVIGFLGSVASVGAFTAFFFASLIAIYVGAVIVAVLSISTVTFFCICAALTVAGWIAVLWVLWQGFKKGVDIFKAFFLIPVASSTTVTSRGPGPFEKVQLSFETRKS